MARPRGDGIKVTKVKQPDGSYKEYRYLRRAVDKPTQFDGTVGSLITEYQGSTAYKKKADGTRKFYDRHLEVIRETWGHFALHLVKPADIQRTKDALQSQPSKANARLAVLSLLFTFAVRRNYCVSNPAANPGKIEPPKRDEIWSIDEERRVRDAFRPSLQLALMLLLYTLQRPSDMLAMTRGQIEERDGRLFIGLRQQKTKDRTNELLMVPVHRSLEVLLRARLANNSGGLLLVPSPKGKQWTRRNFSRAWDHDLRRANLRLARELFRAGWTKDQVRADLEGRHRQRRDLRRTGAVRLAEAGATTPQIAAVAGWAIDYTQKIVDTYVPRRAEIALAGIETWERGDERRSNVTRLADHLKKP